MIAALRKPVSGWGNTFPAHTALYRPEKTADIEATLAQAAPTFIGRGLGRSYGDAAAGVDSTILAERLDRFIAFDAEQGLLRVQAGVTLADMQDVIIPQGWIFPVLPGTQYITAGGMVACNCHGKNQYHEGDLLAHVESLRLRLPDGRLGQCSPTEHADVLRATVGGMGMTGLIEDVTFRLKRIPSLSLRCWRKRVASLDEMLSSFEHKKNQAEYLVGWIDHTATGPALGSGVFEAASHVGVAAGGKPLSEYTRDRRGLSVPPVPGFLLNRLSITLYNRLRLHRAPTECQLSIVPFTPFFHPLDRLRHWNRLYGRNGLVQFQCLVPEGPECANRLRDLLAFTHAQGLTSYLTALEYHQASAGLMSFCAPGYSLAMDFRNTPRTRQLIDTLNRRVCGWGGRVYLAKDALMTPDVFEAMYANDLPAWRRVLRSVDPQGRLCSAMAKRLRFRRDDA